MHFHSASHTNFSGLKKNKNKTNKNPLELNNLSEQKLTLIITLTTKDKECSIQSHKGQALPSFNSQCRKHSSEHKPLPSFTVAVD